MTGNDMINSIIAMNKEQQEAFYDSLRESGINDDDILTIQKQVFFTRLFNNTMFYEDVKNAVGNMVYEALTNE